jgi:hypothetical protein
VVANQKSNRVQQVDPSPKRVQRVSLCTTAVASWEGAVDDDRMPRRGYWSPMFIDVNVQRWCCRRSKGRRELLMVNNPYRRVGWPRAIEEAGVIAAAGYGDPDLQ